MIVLLGLALVALVGLQWYRSQQQLEALLAHHKTMFDAFDACARAIDASEDRIVVRFDDLFGQTVTRLTELESKPAEVIVKTIDVPVIPDSVMAKVRSVAGPNAKDTIILTLMNETEKRIDRLVTVDRRKRSPQIRVDGKVYQAVRESADGWIYRRTEGR